MGRPWRKRERAVPEVSNDYKWSSQSYTLKDILGNFKLPVVVQCRGDTNAEHLQNFFFDLRQPLLLHSKRTSRKVFARCVRQATPGGTVKELLPEVVIPEDYAGWFKISRGLEFSKPTPHRNLESIVNTDAEFFLCTTQFNAIVMTDGDGNEAESIVRPVVEGEVLRKTGIQKLNSLLLPEAERSLTGDNRYLMCIDEKDCELFVPVSQSGLFYEVSDGNFDKNDNTVVQISDILDEMVEMPLFVRHILGDPPPISKFYSPSLKLVRVMEEETVMGSNIDAEEDSLPLEIQTNSPIKFEIALNTPMLQLCGEYNEALEMCNNVCENYVTDMKLAVTFKLKPEEEDPCRDEINDNLNVVPDDKENLDSLTNSARTTTSVGKESECGDIDANSEFSIQWKPIPSVRNTPENQPITDSVEADRESVDSVDTEQAKKLNTVLGGHFFDTEHKLTGHSLPASLPQPDQWWSQSLSDTNTGVKGQAAQNSDTFVPNTKQTVADNQYDHITEGITDFSVRSVPYIENVRTSSPTAVIAPPTSFSDSLSSLPSTVTARSSARSTNVHSSTSTVGSSSISQIDVRDHFPRFHDDKNFGLPNVQKSNQHRPYIFTGDVFISPDTDSSSDSLHSRGSSPGSVSESWSSWESNKFRVIRSRDIRDIPRNGRTNPLPDLQTSSQFRSSSLSDDLIQFDEPSKASSTSSIITCKVADEMVSSFNDLRLSLEEITRNARDSHTENSWKAFCLERSSSLPIRSNTSKPIKEIDEHSQSWEQLSPRKSESNSNSLISTPRHSAKTKHRTLNTKVEKLNIDHDMSLCDKTQLLSETSSEDGSQFSQRSLSSDERLDVINTSFALSESSDMSVTEGPESVLAAIKEIDISLDRCSTGGSVKTADSLTRDKIAIAQKIKIQHEIKRKQYGDWNDTAEVI